MIQLVVASSFAWQVVEAVRWLGGGDCRTFGERG